MIIIVCSQTRKKNKKKVYGQNKQFLEEYREVSKDNDADAAKFKEYKGGRYKKIADTAKFQTETRTKRLTESPNSSQNTYDEVWDAAEVGDTLELIGRGKHRRDVHLGKSNKRNISRDWSSTAKKRKNEGKTYMSKLSHKLMPGRKVYFHSILITLYNACYEL